MIGRKYFAFLQVAERILPTPLIVMMIFQI